MATNKYDEIAQAAITLFNRKGYHATSVQDIADEVGLQKGSLYHYINSKEELLLEIATKSINGFCRELEAVCEQASTAQEKLERAIYHHFDIVIGHLEMTTVLLREAFFLSDDQHKLIKDANDRYLNLWVQIIQEGIVTHEFRGEDPRLTALSILGSCNWVYRWYKADGKKSPQEIAHYFCDLHLLGVLNR